MAFYYLLTFSASLHFFVLAFTLLLSSFCVILFVSVLMSGHECTAYWLFSDDR